MPTIDSSNRTVVEHLARHGFPAHTLTVETAPEGRWFVTTVRNARRDTTWAAQTAVELDAALAALPGRPHVQSSSIRDLFTIIWDGA
jgi:hypothetical protein